MVRTGSAATRPGVRKVPSAPSVLHEDLLSGECWAASSCRGILRARLSLGAHWVIARYAVIGLPFESTSTVNPAEAPCI